MELERGLYDMVGIDEGVQAFGGTENLTANEMG